MRIALVCPDSKNGKADLRRCPSRLRGMAEAFARGGHEVTLLLAGQQASVEGMTVREMRVPVTAREVDWHFSQIQPELVIERLLPGHTECANAAAESSLPLLYELESAALAADPDGVRAVLQGAAERGVCAGVVVSCEEDARTLHAVAGELLPVEVVEDAVSPALFKAADEKVMALVARRLRLASGQVRVGFAGPLTRESGVLDLIRAAAEMRERGVPRLLLLGDGPARNEALRLAVELEVKLTMCGWVSEDELPAHLASCDFVVTGEGGGALPLLQAMAARRAVIAPDAAATRRIARDGAEARLAPPGNLPRLAAALRELLDDGALRMRLGDAACKRVAKSFTWDAQGARVLEFACAMVGRSRAV